ncbi:MAG TPA: cobyric acid synthase [Nitrososphaeraceae archaeon]|jgi:adenosylcobyric acid synthase|nr:cobyric acid synthase [Nitrososphaeraceae archaeon]
MNSMLLMIQGTSSGSGKSTIVTALCRIFADKGYNVAPFKAQNMSSYSYMVSKTSHSIAMAQAIQAVASRKEPDVRMNPILLKPLGNYRSSIILNGIFYSEMYAKEYYKTFVLQKGFPIILNSLESLRRENDIIIIEGAGSPAEINISKYDVANMLLAEKIRAPVIITADIERGGCFASMIGTLKLLKPHHRDLVKGFLINKFLGDESLLDKAIKFVEKTTRKNILGVIPKVEFDLPNEDSLDTHTFNYSKLPRESWDCQIDIIAKAVKNSIDIQKIITEIAGLKI